MEWSSWSVHFSMYMHKVLWSGVSQDSTECFLGVVEHGSNSTQSALCQSLGFDSGPSLTGYSGTILVFSSTLLAICVPLVS